jgi:hypothetical protein
MRQEHVHRLAWTLRERRSCVVKNRAHGSAFCAILQEGKAQTFYKRSWQSLVVGRCLMAVQLLSGVEKIRWRS